MKCRFKSLVALLLVQSALAKSPAGHEEYQAGVRLMNTGEEVAAEGQFRKSTELGYPDAFSALGFFYSNGRGGLKKDDGKAFEFFQKGADLGSQAAQVNLARFHLEGRGTPADREKGLFWMEKAASKGSGDAHAALAEIYFLGLYCVNSRPDYGKALPHVEASSEAGNAAAMNMLGVLLREGYAVPKDSARAEELFRKAARKGNLKAQSNLGHLLDPISKDKNRRIEAAVWFFLAKWQGEPLAIYKIEELQATMDPSEFEEARIRAEELRLEIFKEKSHQG